MKITISPKIYHPSMQMLNRHHLNGMEYLCLKDNSSNRDFTMILANNYDNIYQYYISLFCNHCITSKLELCPIPLQPI